MFNWTYFFCYFFVGMVAAATSEPQIKGPHRCPAWANELSWMAPILNIGLLLMAIYSGVTFGIGWGFLSFGEAVLGAMAWGAIRSGK